MRTHFRFRKALAFLLAALMILGMAPAMALGAGAADSSTSDAFYRIVHLDCGRKYFTADWIKALITEMKAAGYTHLELAIGNDGLRFLLDDMSVTANDTIYSSADVTAGIRSGNKAYHDFGTNELTQTEMDGIIAHANKHPSLHIYVPAGAQGARGGRFPLYSGGGGGCGAAPSEMSDVTRRIP